MTGGSTASIGEFRGIGWIASAICSDLGIMGTGTIFAVGSSETGSSAKCDVVVPNMLLHSSSLKFGKSSTSEATVVNQSSKVTFH